ADGGVDSAFSVEPGEFRQLTVESERAWQGLGRINYGPLEQEKPSMQFRRSLYIAEEVPAGGRLTAKNLRIIRPGFGLPPKMYEVVLGKRVARLHKCGEPLTWESLMDGDRSHNE